MPLYEHVFLALFRLRCTRRSEELTMQMTGIRRQLAASREDGTLWAFVASLILWLRNKNRKEHVCL